MNVQAYSAIAKAAITVQVAPMLSFLVKGLTRTESFGDGNSILISVPPFYGRIRSL